MAFEGSAASVFEHPLASGESFAARTLKMSSPFGQKNQNPGGLGPSSLEAGLGSAFRPATRAGASQKNPQAAPAAAEQDSGDITSLAQMAHEAQMRALQQAAYVGASQAAWTASSAVKEGASTISAQVRANPYSVTTMSCVGGLILASSSLMHLVWILHVINPLSYILRVYEFCFGLLIAIIDCPAGAVPRRLRSWAYGLAPMQTNTNRVLFYLFIACLQGSLGTWFNTACGWYFATVAVLFTIVTASGATGQKSQEQKSPRGDRGSPGGDRGVPLAQPCSQLY